MIPFPVARGAAPAAGAAPGIRFRWALVAATGPGRELATITRDTALRSGDEIKMRLRLESACFVYVLHHDSDGGFTLLFPYQVTDLAAGRVRTGADYLIPQGESWFRLDEKAGWERIYVLAADERLVELERRCEEYRTAAGEARRRVGEQLAREIRELRRSGRVSQAAVDRPARVGGTVRGKEGEGRDRVDWDTRSSVHAGSKLVTHAITIDHQ